jgi:protein-S-isoprenylcysteine O-methyltransferase Ste14
MAAMQSAPQSGRIKEVPMKLRLFSVIAVFAAFAIYTTIVVLNHGYTGFLELAMTGGWGAQVFIDLTIALILFAIWMIPDAREHGIPAWPYFLAILTTGSVGALAYLVHRTAKEQSISPSTKGTVPFSEGLIG